MGLWHGRLSRAHTHVMSSSYFILNGYGLSLQLSERVPLIFLSQVAATDVKSNPLTYKQQ